ncbi:MAG: hypothetical protein HQL71_15205 [Magnetococcales bacterium]|nr:hypothetical protein [Magnetococcales bacterium]
MNHEIFIGRNSKGYYIGHSGITLLEHASITDIQSIVPALEEHNCTICWLNVDVPSLPQTEFNHYVTAMEHTDPGVPIEVANTAPGLSLELPVS